MSEQQYTQTEEYPKMMAYLIEKIGVERREAELSLRDGDLWPLIDAGSMYPFEGEEAVAQWEAAVDFFSRLVDFTQPDDNPAVNQGLIGAIVVAEEMLKRARERVSEASTE
jgi:hypothetical protein